MNRRSFFSLLLAVPLAVAAFVREPIRSKRVDIIICDDIVGESDKLTDREYDEFLELAMRYQIPKKSTLT